MKTTLVFASANDNRVISESDMGSADPMNAVPMAGDEVRWVADDKVYAGRVKSRLVSYSAPNKIGLERADDVDVKIVLTVDLAA